MELDVGTINKVMRQEIFFETYSYVTDIESDSTKVHTVKKRHL